MGGEVVLAGTQFNFLSRPGHLLELEWSRVIFSRVSEPSGGDLVRAFSGRRCVSSGAGGHLTQPAPFIFIFSAAHFFSRASAISALLSHDSALSGQRRRRRQSKEWGEPFCFFLIAFPSFFSVGILRAHPHSKCTKVRRGSI